MFVEELHVINKKITMYYAGTTCQALCSNVDYLILTIYNVEPQSVTLTANWGVCQDEKNASIWVIFVNSVGHTLCTRHFKYRFPHLYQ